MYFSLWNHSFTNIRVFHSVNGSSVDGMKNPYVRKSCTYVFVYLAYLWTDSYEVKLFLLIFTSFLWIRKNFPKFVKNLRVIKRSIYMGKFQSAITFLIMKISLRNFHIRIPRQKAVQKMYIYLIFEKKNFWQKKIFLMKNFFVKFFWSDVFFEDIYE